MSLLRQRATPVKVLSTRNDRRPAEARLRLVRATSSRSELELKLPADHAAAGCGIASPTPHANVAARTRLTRWRVERTDMRSVGVPLGRWSARGEGFGGVLTVGS